MKKRSLTGGGDDLTIAENNIPKDIDILVIHKTLFEKLKSDTDSGWSDEKIKSTIEELEKKIPVVVLTSGRGGQQGAGGGRFMPFAVLEHYLMAGSHSKLLAVAALLNAREGRA